MENLNKDAYSENKNNLGENYIEKVIEGGNHSSFASYGHQKNDGELKIDNQIEVTANEISSFVYNAN